MDDVRAAPNVAADYPAISVLGSESRPGELKAAVPDTASSRPTSQRRGFQARLVEDRDREAVRGILRDLHGISVFRAQAFSDRKMDKMFDRVAARPPEMAGIVAEHNGTVVGVAWAMVSDYLLTDSSPFVTVHLIAVNRKMGSVRRAKAFLTLVAAIRQWAAAQQASPVFFHVMTGANLSGTDRLMRATGVRCVGGSYVA